MLLNEIKSAPNSAGIYQYFDKDKNLLYIGKAKVLKNRVKSYFVFTPNLAPNPNLSPRIHKMISQVESINYITTKSENDALILENSFIKQLKPKYNILLRDDKTFPYIYVDLSASFPRFEITRKVVKGDKILYFGPFFKGSREILDAIYLNFKLVQKSSCVKSKKSCIFYQINRCHAPCEGKISQDEYKKILNEAIKCLKNPNLLVPNLTNLMQKYAIGENYEEAAKIRDKITTIKEITIKTEIDLAKLEDFEVICVDFLQDIFCFVLFSVRDGKVSGQRHKISRAKMVTNNEINEIYKQAILEAFPSNSPFGSTKIYTNDKFDDMDLVAEILTQRHKKKFSIISPKIGEKRGICEIAKQNCEILLQNYSKSSQNLILDEIREYFGLENYPSKIEAFDNSHLFGKANVGAMISWELEGFCKENYRHFHLNFSNDYDQMNELLTQRAMRFDKLSPPDLWIIDGGEALLNLALQIINSTGVNTDVIAISKEKIDAKAKRAKGGANDKIYTKNGAISLNPNDKRLQFIQKMRDEAHRFALSFHKKVKQKEDLESSNLQKAGISLGSIRKLLNFYGSFDEIYKADLNQISNLTNKNVMEKIQNFLKNKSDF